MDAYGRRSSPSKSSWRRAVSSVVRRGLALLVAGLVVYPITEVIRQRNMRRSWR